MKQDTTNLFVFIDDFYKAADLYISHHFISENQKSYNPTRIPTMTISEILTIVLLYQKSPCKNFKYFYQSYLQLYKPEFPNLVSYERFVSLKPRYCSHEIAAHNAIHLICTAARNEVPFLTYLVAMPLHRFR